jgi:pSer/pThr/pTyr-binding forkhead associated (FHA) protein
MMDLDVLVLALRGILIFCLYGFLIFTLVVVWRDTSDRRTDRTAEPSMTPSAQLVVVDAGGSGLAAGTQFVLVANGTLGRTELNSIVIPDPAVSARHCRLSYRKGQWWIDDLGSANGTRVNGNLVTASTLLNDGDVVEVAQVKFVMETT